MRYQIKNKKTERVVFDYIRSKPLAEMLLASLSIAYEVIDADI